MVYQITISKKDRQSHVVQIMLDRQDRRKWHLNLSFQLTCDFRNSCDVFFFDALASLKTTFDIQ
jgi:hypothetical protein